MRTHLPKAGHAARTRAAVLSAALLISALSTRGVCLAVTPAPPEDASACSYTGIASHVPHAVSSTPSYFWLEQEEYYWAAIGVRSEAGSDWDVQLFDTTAAPEQCVNGLLARSDAVSGVDFVVGDYNWQADPPWNEYASVTRASGGGNAIVEWDGDADGFGVNYPVTYRTTGPFNVLEAWDVWMSTGQEYVIEFTRNGPADTKLLLFHNPTDAPYFVPRSARILETTSPTTLFTPSDSGYYGIVVVNDNGANGTYSVRIGACFPPVTLASGVTAEVPPVMGYYLFTQGSPAWTAVGAREFPGKDWDITLHSTWSGSPWPICFAGQLLVSQDVGKVDFIVGDFNHNPVGGTYFVRPYQYDPGFGEARVEWDDGADSLVSNGPAALRSFDWYDDILEAWDVSLSAGGEYTFEFSPSGQGKSKVLLFMNQAGVPYWAPRAGAEFEETGSVAYTAPVAGRYGVVVVNDSMAAGSYRLGVRHCTLQGLASGQSVPTDTLHGFYNSDQQTNYWSAVGVRGDVPSADWDIQVGLSYGDNPWPNCVGNLVASSIEVGKADFIVGDFNHNPYPDFFYTRAYRYDGTGNGRTEWDDGSDQLAVDGPFVSRTTDANDVLEVWDLQLAQGQQVYFIFDRQGAANTKLLVFKSNGATYWAGRSDNVLETTSFFTPFTAPAADWYGVVVVNDNGGAGTYRLKVSSTLTDVASAGDPPLVTELLPPAPNPAKGAARIRFQLAAPAEVAIDIVDVSGRVVASLPRRSWLAGPAQVEWDGRDGRGRRVSAGIYWVRMSADGREVGRSKLILVS